LPEILGAFLWWLGDTFNINKIQGGFWKPIESVFVVDGQEIKRGSLSHLANSNGNYAKKRINQPRRRADGVWLILF
jgi:hypothetical protein